MYSCLVSIMSTTSPSEPKSDIDFTALPWNLNVPTEHSYLHITTTTGTWDDDLYLKNDSTVLQKSIYQYGTNPLQLFPATTSLNYGTTIWEGLKCYRIATTTASSRIGVFRPDQNYERMKDGANEMCLPMPSKQLFFRCIQLIIQTNSHLIPPVGDGMKLYIRPMLVGTGQQLGLYPSSQFSFIVYVSPTGSYFSSSSPSMGLNLHLETRRARAAMGGMGSIKCSGNYAAALKPLMDCKKHGFNDNLFIELETLRSNANTVGNDRSSSYGPIGNAIVQEMSAANVFFVLKTGEIVTPSLQRRTILPGVTRSSVLTLIDVYATELLESINASIIGLEDPLTPTITTVYSSSRDVMVYELEDAIEAFCTGTAAEIVPIASIATSPDDDKQYEFKRHLPYGQSCSGPVTTKLLSMMREVMSCTRHIPMDNASTNTAGDNPVVGETNYQIWVRDPYSSMDDFCNRSFEKLEK